MIAADAQQFKFQTLKNSLTAEERGLSLPHHPLGFPVVVSTLTFIRDLTIYYIIFLLFREAPRRRHSKRILHRRLIPFQQT